MIASTLKAAPHVSDAETLLAEIYRQRVPAAEPAR
jgi:hypothetical protein